MVKRLAQWSFLLSLSLVIAAVVGEIALRIYDAANGVTAPYTHNLPECLAVPNGYYNYGLEPDVSVVYDSHNPREFTINRWGFRGENFDPVKPEGVKRVFCLGGSSTFDPYVGDDATWPALLGRKLNREVGDSIECINAGRYGYTTAEILGLIHHRIMRYDPDLIILYSTYNDSRKVMSPYFGADDFPQLYGNPKLSFLNKNSALFAFFDFRLRHVWKWDWYTALLPSYAYKTDAPKEHFDFLEDKELALQFNLREFERNLKAIQLLTQDAGVELLVCTQLIDTSGTDASPMKSLMVQELTRCLKDLSASDSIPMLDFAKSEQDGILETYVHFTPHGCKVFSDSLAAKILQHGLLDH